MSSPPRLARPLRAPRIIGCSAAPACAVTDSSHSECCDLDPGGSVPGAEWILATDRVFKPWATCPLLSAPPLLRSARRRPFQWTFGARQRFAKLQAQGPRAPVRAPPDPCGPQGSLRDRTSRSAGVSAIAARARAPRASRSRASLLCRYDPEDQVEAAGWSFEASHCKLVLPPRRQLPLMAPGAPGAPGPPGQRARLRAARNADLSDLSDSDSEVHARNCTVAANPADDGIHGWPNGGLRPWHALWIFLARSSKNGRTFQSLRFPNFRPGHISLLPAWVPTWKPLCLRRSDARRCGLTDSRLAVTRRKLDMIW